MNLDADIADVIISGVWATAFTGVAAYVTRTLYRAKTNFEAGRAQRLTETQAFLESEGVKNYAELRTGLTEVLAPNHSAWQTNRMINNALGKLPYGRFI